MAPDADLVPSPTQAGVKKAMVYIDGILGRALARERVVLENSRAPQSSRLVWCQSGPDEEERNMEGLILRAIRV